MSRLRLILLLLLPLIVPVGAAAQISGVASLSTGVARIDRFRVLNGHADIQVIRADLMLWRRDSPFYAGLGFSLGLEGDGTHRYLDGGRDYRARANYLDASIGVRLPASPNLAFTFGFGPWWLPDGYLNATDEHQTIEREDLARLGYHVQLAAMATESHGLALHLGARIRGLRSDEAGGDVVYVTQYGGLELTAGVGLQFGRRDRRPAIP